MDPKKFFMTQIALIELGKQIEALDLQGFLEGVVKAEKQLELLTDEKLKARAKENLIAVATLTRAFQLTKDAFTESRKVITGTNAAYLVTPETEAKNV